MAGKIIGENIYYWCEGCGHTHNVPMKRWNFSGNEESFSLSPSVRHFYRHLETEQEVTVCHYFIKDGYIEYCGDCPHKLNGQKVKLIEIPEGWGLPNE